MQHKFLSKQCTLAPSPTHISRVPIFAPTRRPDRVRQFRVVTSWGEATVTGRLGQPHRDILDAARFVAERIVRTGEGRMHLLVDSARVRAKLGWGSVSYAQILRRLRDLREAEIDLCVPARGLRIIGGILDEIVEAAVPPPPRSGSRARQAAVCAPVAEGPPRGGMVWRITLSRAWTTLVEADLETRYPLTQVLRMSYGISQALARYCLTHRRVHEPLPALLGRLGATRALRKLRRELQADSEILTELGIRVEQDYVVYQSGAGRQTPEGGRQIPEGGRQIPENQPPVNIVSKTVEAGASYVGPASEPSINHTPPHQVENS